MYLALFFFIISLYLRRSLGIDSGTTTSDADEYAVPHFPSTGSQARNPNKSHDIGGPGVQVTRHEVSNRYAAIGGRLIPNSRRRTNDGN